MQKQCPQPFLGNHFTIRCRKQGREPATQTEIAQERYDTQVPSTKHQKEEDTNAGQRRIKDRILKEHDDLPQQITLFRLQKSL